MPKRTKLQRSLKRIAKEERNKPSIHPHKRPLVLFAIADLDRPTCAGELRDHEGHDCSITENPSHWVSIKLSEDVKGRLRHAASLLDWMRPSPFAIQGAKTVILQILAADKESV